MTRNVFLTTVAAIAMMAHAGREATESVRDRMSPWTILTVLPTFAERPIVGVGVGSDYERLRRVVADADPQRVLVANHPVR